IQVSGGTSPYEYSWSNGMGNQYFTPSVLLAGKYFISVSDTLGCNINDSITINEPDIITLGFSKSSSKCDSTTGTVTVTSAGGTGVKNYLWTFDGLNSNVHNNLLAGEYSILVTDANGCSVFGSVQISDSDGPEVSINTITPVTCFEGSDGGV